MAKTLDGRGADLLTHFATREPATFSVAEAAEYLGATAETTSRILSTLTARGWISRHVQGVYEIAPLWASPSRPFDPDRYSAIARWIPEPYYIAFRSALEIRDWLDYPVRGRLWIVVPHSRHTPSTFRDRVIWVVMRPERLSWGREKHWVRSDTVWVSDPERTVLDGLHLPRHMGGVTEVASLLRRIWSQLDQNRLIDYCQRLDIDSVRRRLGWTLGELQLPGAAELMGQLQRGLSKSRRSPVTLDPTFPAVGFVDRQWGVLVNVPKDDFDTAGTT